MPAMPDPKAKVSASTRPVRIPMVAAMRRFCTTARISSPKRVKRMAAITKSNTAMPKTIIQSRFCVTLISPGSISVPCIQVGLETSLFCAPKISRTACCNIMPTPKVISRVSSGRP